MKSLFVGFALIAGLACGGATGPGPQGTVYFKMDGLSCKYTGSRNVTFYIATTEAGTESLAGDATSAAYLTKPSARYAEPERNPVVWARIANYTPEGNALWTHASNINVTLGEPVTYTVIC